MSAEKTLNYPMHFERREPSAKTVKAAEKRRAERAKGKGTAHHAKAQVGAAAAEAKTAEADAKKKIAAEAKKKTAADKKAKAATDALAAAQEHAALVNACPLCNVKAGELCITGGDKDKPRLEPHKDRIDALG